MFLLRRLLGVKTEDKKQTKVTKLVKGELLLINIGSTSTGGRVLSVKADLAKIQLTSPACTEIGEKVALSRRIEKHWRLVGTYLPVCSLVMAAVLILYQVGALCSAALYWKSIECTLAQGPFRPVQISSCSNTDLYLRRVLQQYVIFILVHKKPPTTSNVLSRA